MKHLILTNELASYTGSRESSKVELQVDTKDGSAELVISKTITERYPVTEYEKVMELHERINRGGGRKLYRLEDLAK